MFIFTAHKLQIKFALGCASDMNDFSVEKYYP